MHVHVHNSEGNAKFWLEPEIELADSNGFPLKVLNKLQNSVERHENEIRASWEKHFGGSR